MTDLLVFLLIAAVIGAIFFHQQVLDFIKGLIAKYKGPGAPKPPAPPATPSA